MYYRIKRQIYDILRDHEDHYTPSTIFDLVIIGLVVINMITIIARTFDGLSPALIEFMDIMDFFTTMIFTVEYIFRIWTADYIYPSKKPYSARLTYAFTSNALIDLVSVVPYFIPFFIPIDLRILRTVRVLRLLQILKFTRYTDALTSLTTVLKKKAPQLISSWLIVLILMIIASVFMYNAEHTAQPTVFKNALSGLWWSIATFSTVGYGDIYPITALGKVLGALITFLGVALVAIPTGIISAGFIEDSNKSQADSNTEAKEQLMETLGQTPLERDRAALLEKFSDSGNKKCEK